MSAATSKPSTRQKYSCGAPTCGRPGCSQRFNFMERFSGAVVHALTKLNAPRNEIAAARRLFVALESAHLSDRT
jgi:hypothetical protein